MEKIIEVFDLKKSYGTTEALKGISFYVEKKSLFAFLGPNGAGKSTTIDVLCTLLQNDAGSAVINGNVVGKDDDKIRQDIGIVFQDSLLDPLLTVRENLYSRGSFYGLDKRELQYAVDNAIKAVKIENLADRRYKTLSGGEKRKADIARALIHSPKILFLDEPTTGLDPKSRQNVWDIVRNLQHEYQTTVFLTTHYMEEAAAADYVVVIKNGLIQAKGTPMEIKEAFSSDRLKMLVNNKEAVEAYLVENKHSYVFQNNECKVDLKDTLEAIDIIKAQEQNIRSFEVLTGSMDEAFINIIEEEIF